MPAGFEVKIDASTIQRLQLQLVDAGRHTPKALRLSINYAGDRAYTQVKRHLSQEVGLQQRELTRSKGLYKSLATNDGRRVSYTIGAKSAWTPLSYYSPTQRKDGVAASPWGKRRVFFGTFLLRFASGHVGVFERIDAAGERVKKLNAEGKVYTSQIGGLRELWGPSLARELSRPATVKIFEATATAAVGPRLQHEIARLMKTKA